MKEIVLKREVFRLLYIIFFLSIVLIYSDMVPKYIRVLIEMSIVAYILLFAYKKIIFTEEGIKIVRIFRFWNSTTFSSYADVENITFQVVTLSASIPSAVFIKRRGKFFREDIEIAYHRVWGLSEFLISKDVKIKPSKNNEFNRHLLKLEKLHIKSKLTSQSKSKE